jgi:hypothetical protein
MVSLFLIGFTTFILSGKDIASWQMGKHQGNSIIANENKYIATTMNNERLSKSAFVPGISGQALTFDGKLMLQVPHRAELDLVNNFTLNCIFKADKIDHYRTIAWKGNRKASPEQINFYLNIKNGKLEFKFKDAAGKWEVISSANAVINSGNWYAVTVTMDKDGEVRGYVNGTMCFNRKIKTGKLTVNTAPLYIGGGHGGAYMFEGVIDSFSIAEGVIPPEADVAGKIASGAKKAEKEMRDLQESARLAVWTFDNVKDGIIPGVRTETDITVKNLKNGKVLADGLNGKAFIAANGSNVLSVPHSQSISLKNDFTIRCIFKAEKTDSYRTLLWKGNRNVKPQQINYYLSIRDGKPEFKFKDKNGDWHVVMSSTPLIESGKWYYLVVTMDEYGTITGYLNGKMCFQMKYAPGTLVENEQLAYIGVGAGHTGGGFAYPFDGLIDELTITRGVVPPSAKEINEFNKRVEKYWNKYKKNVQADREKLINMAVSANLLKASEAEKHSDETLQLMLRKNEYRSFFNKNARNKSLLITTLPTAQRVLNTKDYVKGKFHLNTKAELLSARNEREGFQVVLLGNPDKTIDNVKVKLPELRSKAGNIIKTDALEWGYILPITSERPEYPIDFVGDYPDVIMEGQADTFSVPAGGFSTVYIRAKVDKEVPAGLYSGQMEIATKDSTYKVDMSLEVKDFTLPVTSSIKVIFSFFESFYAKWYDYKSLSDEQKMRIYDFLLKYRITPNNIYASDIYPELKFMPELKKKGANFITLGYLAEKGKVDQKRLDEIINIYRKRIETVTQAGFGNMAYLYAYDELGEHSKTEKVAKQIMAEMKKTFPKLRSIQTSYPYPNLLPFFDVWVPLFNYPVSSGNKMQELKKAGKEFWWYTADNPTKPFPNFFLDYPVFDNRIIFTLSYMYDMGGVLYWCINREWATNMDIKGQWPDKSWKPYIFGAHNNKRKFSNGMGNYVYPGKDGRILPSLRLENLRDGIEDYEYLVMLKELTSELIKQKPESKLIAEAEKLLKVPTSVAIAVNDYSGNPANLLQYRKNIANMIVKIKNQLKKGD